MYTLYFSKRENARAGRPYQEEDTYETRLRTGESTGSTAYPTLLNHEKTCMGPGCDYEHMWNTFPPPPAHLCQQTEDNYSLDTRYQKRSGNSLDNALCPFKECDFERISMARLPAPPDCVAQTHDSHSAALEREQQPKLCSNPIKSGSTRGEEVHMIVRDT